MVNILFVCTGNICRSPLAEGILRYKLKTVHLSACVDSCGFESFHIGDNPDPRAQAVATRHGLDISAHRARLFSNLDCDRFDMIYVMDSGHFRNVLKLSRNESDRTKVDYILNVLYPGQNLGVMDPWYHDNKAFEMVYLQLDKACERISQKLISETKQR
ncbi:MAG: low molecular weight protein-tyrosine-phosphatase [Bacteroidota bacterium]